MITSRQNPHVKQLCALRNRSQRERTGQTLVYGVRESQRALAAGGRVLECLWCDAYFRSDAASQVVDQLGQAGAELRQVSAEVFEKLAYGDRLDGVVAVFATPTNGLAQLPLPACPLVAVIEGVEKPGNLGALLRTADGAGLDAVVVVDPVIDLFNPNVIRASMATVFQPNIAVADVGQTLTWLEEHQLTIWAARPDAATVYHEVDFTAPGAIVLGNEAAGLSQAWARPQVVGVSLPMQGIADSLNVSATAAILFYEARRQRQAGIG